MINKVSKEFPSKQYETPFIGTDNEERIKNVKNHLLILPYKGSDVMRSVSSLRKQVNCGLPDNEKLTVSSTGKKRNVCFNLKDETVFNHEHDIVYYAKCPEESCPHDYVGESGGVLERVKDHNGRETSYHIFKHCVAANYQIFSCDDLELLVEITEAINGNGKLQSAIS